MKAIQRIVSDPSAYKVSNAKDDFPEPERPVITNKFYLLEYQDQYFLRFMGSSPRI